MKIKDAKKKIVALNQQLAEAHEELKQTVAESFITCDKCGKRSKVKNITIVQTHWYVTPSGCTGGDYWKQGEKEFTCQHCGKINRGINTSYGNEKFYELAEKYTSSFKGLVKTYDD